MSRILTSNEVGWALMQAGLTPFTLDTEMFQIVREGENYIVHTDRLPEIYIEKKVTLNQFEYKDENWIVCYAMDRVNLRRTPVVVFRAESRDTVTFRICLSPVSIEAFSGALDSTFVTIEQAVEAFGHACEVAVRDEEEDTMTQLMESLANPSPDSPWIRGKRSS